MLLLRRPVLLTGNYTLTVRRLLAALRGRDVWLVVANSRGINVWCASGGGHLTHHEVISALRTSRVEAEVDHREVVVPQLAATGVDRRRLAASGWKVRWGPARLDDLPAFLDRGCRIAKSERRVRFPLRDRCEMAATWFTPMAVVAGLVVGLAASWLLALVAVANLAVLTFGVFAAVPWLNLTARRSLVACAGGGVAAFTASVAALAALGLAGLGAWMTVSLTSLLGAAVLAIDLPGTTPWYPSTINTFSEPFTVDLEAKRCTGAADCVQVCPRDVLRMDGKRR
jgi:hypothetical protein